MGCRRPRAHLLRDGPRRAAARAQSSGGRRGRPRPGGPGVSSWCRPRARERLGRAGGTARPLRRAGALHLQRDRGVAARAAGRPGRHRAGHDREAGRPFLRLARPGGGRVRPAVRPARHRPAAARPGPAPPFDQPDTAGLPRGLASSVAVIPADEGALAGVLRTRDVAAVILEPSGAAWGTVPLPPGFLAAARRLASESGTLLVFDEVVSGFRWAPGGVQQVTGVVPDLTVLGKVLAGGMPGGAVGGRADLMDHLAGPVAGSRRVAHPGTHNAHPLAAAAGLTTLGLAASGELQAGADQLAASLR